MHKVVKRILVIISIVLVLLFVAGLFAGNYFYNLALNPGSDKSSVLDAEHNTLDTSGIDSSRAENAQWFSQSGREDEYLTSRDGLRLHAYRLEQPEYTTHWAVLCHGYTGSAGQMAYTARHFYQLGYNLLVPDARGHGLSEGDYIGMGWDDRLDLVDWAGALAQQDAAAQIVLYGVSMGGATVMMASGEELPANVKAVVEDCGYSSIWGEFAYQLGGIFNLPGFPILNFASLVTKVRAGYWLGEGDALAQVGKSVTPMLFIHGDADTFVPASMVYEVYEAANVEKEIVVVPGAGHGGAASTLGQEYWDRVEAFLSRYIQ